MAKVSVRRGLVVLAIAGLALASAPELLHTWTFARVLEGGTRHVDGVEYVLDSVYPGVPEAGRLLRASPQPVWCLPRAEDPHLFQRLFEMTHPRRLEPFDPVRARAGDLVAMPPDGRIPLPSDVVFARGTVKVVRIR